MATLDYLLVAGVGLTAFIVTAGLSPVYAVGLMLLLKRVLVTSMMLKTVVYSLPFG